MRLRLGGYFVTADGGHILFASVLAGVVAAYGWSVLAQSSRVADLIFIIPAAALTLVLYAALLLREVSVRRATPDDADVAVAAGGSAADRALLVKQWIYVGAMAGFLVILPWVGIEIATIVFTAGSLWLLGSRSLAVNILLPVGFAAFLSVFFVYLLDLPLKSVLF